MTSRKRNVSEISAQQYVDQLLNEGSKVTCDRRNKAVFENNSLPDFYDEELYKKGQQFYSKYAYSINLAHALGLVALYSITTVLNVIVTASGKPTLLQGFQRQLKANLTLHSFYKLNLDSGSKLWKNILRIKNRHNTVSNGSTKEGLNPVTQKDMVLAQFIFTGLPLVRGDMIGMSNVSEEEWKAFYHLWRVVGYLIGIEDRFNMCSFSLEKTREIAELLIERVFLPQLNKHDSTREQLYEVSCKCWSPMLPELLIAKSAVNYAYNMIRKRNVGICENLEPIYIKMDFLSAVYYKVFCIQQLYLMKFNVIRMIRNVIFEINMYFITNYTVLPNIWFKAFEILDSFL